MFHLSGYSKTKWHWTLVPSRSIVSEALPQPQNTIGSRAHPRCITAEPLGQATSIWLRLPTSPKADVQDRGTRGQITTGRIRKSAAPAAGSGSHNDPRSISVAITSGSFKLNSDPVVVTARLRFGAA